MAKKTAPKKKTAPAKAAKISKKPAKPAAKAVSKPVAKQAAKPAPKAVKKPVVKPSKPIKETAKAAKPAKASSKPEPKAAVSKKPAPSVMSQNEIEADEEKTPVKNKTVISMMEESSGSEEPSKAEKVSKVKPVKIERGNVADEKAKWAELYKKYGKEKAITYKMSDTFPTMIPVQHKVLGWGFVLTNENDRLEVLFETGIRMLISNYKAS